MSKNVFANGRGISAKKDDNRSPAAMPDVCLSPPSPPAGPVPIPYPNTSQASDTSDGSKTVKIGGEEVGMKNSSNYKKSSDDEAATRGLGMGLVTHTIQGKLKHTAWSMDVKIEGANAIRHFDLTTHNHINQGNLAVTLNQEKVLQLLPRELSCEQLEARRDIIERTDLKNKRVGRGRTLAAGQFTDPNGRTGLMKGVSHLKEMVRSGARWGYAKGKKRPLTKTKRPVYYKLKRGGKGRLLYKARKAKKGPVYKGCQQNLQYDARGLQHAEATMIEDILGAAKKANIPMPSGPVGSLTLSIKWKPSDSKETLDKPCPSCKDLICEAIVCGLEISICKQGAQEPTDMREECNLPAKGT